MKRAVFILSLCLLVQSALAQSKGFAAEMWQTTFNSLDPGTAQLPPPAAPWKPAMWTCGIINGIDSNSQDVRKLAKLCSEGGDAKDGLKPTTLAYLRFYHRLDIFPGEKVPPHTLLIADSEGSPSPAGFPTMLATAAKSQTKKYCLYPGALSAGTIASDFSFAWTSQMREVDFFAMSRTVKRAAPYIAMSGDYVLLEMYLGTPESQDQQFRSWSLMLSAMRRAMPDKKILALMQSGYAWPKAGSMTDGERHRLVRFVVLGFDGVWVWGLRDNRVTDDIAALADDPLRNFAGQNWAKE